MMLLTSCRFVGIFVGMVSMPKSRYQHGVDGHEVPKCKGANQATQAFRRWRLAPTGQSGRSQVLALGLSVAWQATYACAGSLSDHWTSGGTYGARRCQAQPCWQHRPFHSET